MPEDLRPPYRIQFDNARDPYTARNALGIAPAGGPFQPLDATLTALAAYNTNGLLTQTAPDTFTGRTIIGPAAGIAVSNGSGVAGNPTLALADDLAALEALGGTNTIYYRSGASAWSAVNVSTGLAFSGGNLTATGTGTSAITRVGVRAFVASGTYTPTAGMKYCIAECVGGGGGGGGAAGTTGQTFAAGGGGSGGYSRRYLTAADVGVGQTVTIGAAGNGGAAGANNGSAGGTTSFGALCSANGGAGGTYGSVANLGLGGAGGVVAGAIGDLTAFGAPGGGGFYNGATAAITIPGGAGGSSVFGGGAPGTAGAGSIAGAFGSGGSGAFAVSGTGTFGGGNGSAGVVIITEFI